MNLSLYSQRGAISRQAIVFRNDLIVVIGSDTTFSIRRPHGEFRGKFAS